MYYSNSIHLWTQPMSKEDNKPEFKDSVAWTNGNFKFEYTEPGDSRTRASIGGIPKALHAEFAEAAAASRLGHAQFLCALLDFKNACEEQR